MKSYRKLFMEGFTFNGKDYCSSSYIMSYCELVKDILEGVHGDVPKSKMLKKMFMKTIYQKSEDMPKSIISRKLYYQLGDIYITKSMGIEAINSVVERIGKYMGKEVVIH
jgi:hypothetical protein